MRDNGRLNLAKPRAILLWAGGERAVAANRPPRLRPNRKRLEEAYKKLNLNRPRRTGNLPVGLGL